jgi:uncharacterized membrane protein YjgN (DUF898 family)
VNVTQSADGTAFRPGGGEQALRPFPTSVPHIASSPDGSSDRSNVPSAGAPIFSWAGPTWHLAGLGLLNFCLNIITLGIYGFWGRTEVRKRIWSSVQLNGEPLAYTGTGRELFFGFLIVFGFILLPTLAITLAGIVWLGQNTIQYTFLQITMGLGFLLLGGIASYRARRYRLSRTAWRGIRGSLEGSSLSYGWTSFWLTLLVPLLTALLAGGLYVSYFGFGYPNLNSEAARLAVLAKGQIWIGLLYLFFVFGSLLIIPWRTTMLTRHMTNDMAFGSAPFSFDGSASALYARFILRWIGVAALLFAVPAAIYGWLGAERMGAFVGDAEGAEVTPFSGREIAGIVVILFVASMLYSVLTAWYKALELNYFALSTRYSGEQFKLNVTARGLIWLVLTNAPMTLLSLGILRPVAQARTAKYIVENLALVGPIDFATIAQSAAARSKTGEGLAQAFDVDAF